MNKKDKQKDKQDRLAQALRDNLKRRKAPPPPTPQTQTPLKINPHVEKE